MVDVIKARRVAAIQPSAFETTYSVTRKELLEFTSVVGISTIHNGKYLLSEVLSAAIDNNEFNDELKKSCWGMMTPSIEKLFGPPENARQIIEQFQNSEGERRDELFEAYYRSFQNTGFDHELLEVENLVWKRCEKAIREPRLTLKTATPAGSDFKFKFQGN